MKKIILGLFALSVSFLTGCDILFEESIYFEVLDLAYDGPTLDNSWFLLDDYYKLGVDYNNDEELQGTGKAFEVTLGSAVDGDTAYFNLPSEYSEYTDKSFRFLNIDTEETYGTKEEWGKPASVYTSDMLTNAYSIVLQNDPNEGIYDIYGRGLAWIWVKCDEDSEYELLNYKLVQQGLAQSAYLWGAGETIYSQDISYTQWILNAEKESIKEKRGMHSDLLDPYWDYENNAATWSLVDKYYI